MMSLLFSKSFAWGTVWVIKSTRFVFFKKSLFSPATEMECLEHGMVRSMVN